MPRINKKDTPAPWKPKQVQQVRLERNPLYNSRRWRKARTLYLAANPLCKGCNRLATVVDHINPVRLGGSFWDPDNWQGLCSHCHNSKSGKERHNLEWTGI